jgi:hypothetical protein
MNLRSFKPAYFFKRLGQMRFEKSHPEAPWLAESAVLLLDSYLKPTDIGFEWGSGRSTLWLARRVAHLHSVEDNRLWYRTVKKKLEAAQLSRKVTYQFIPCEWTEVDEPSGHPYAQAADAIPDNSLDFAFVDGNIRASCLRVIMTKLNPGGLLILDNANRFIPNRHWNGHTTVHERRSKPRSVAWSQMMERLKDWRWINTTNGIWDTRFWIKPLNSAPIYGKTKIGCCLVE